MELKDYVTKLRESLNLANQSYYVYSTPIMSDYEFDMKMKELESLELQHPELDDINSPTHRVGSDIAKSGFNQVNHDYPMLSLANTYNKMDLIDFDERIRKALPGEDISYCCELKYDGVSISLKYENGKLVRAATRGDGLKGDDVTDNVRTIKSVPLNLIGQGYPSEFEIRGEVLMPHSSFNKINSERESEGLPLFANCRNAASGSLKSLNSSTTAKRGLDCVLYFLSFSPTNNQQTDMIAASEWGFKTGVSAIAKNVDEIFQFINYWGELKNSLQFDIDGIVIKLNEVGLRDRVGYTSKVPKWAVAYKYPAENVQTKLLSVDYQVGRTGIITPVANVTPVKLSGTVVSRATLHNFSIVKSMDLRIGDTLFIEKAAEVIPKITGVNLTKRTEDLIPVPVPNCCPICGGQVEFDESGVGLRCVGVNCPATSMSRILHFCSKDAMDINIGPSRIESLFVNGVISNFLDLYSLTVDTLKNVPTGKFTKLGKPLIIGDVVAKKIVDSIQNSKLSSFDRVLFSLGIPCVGKTTAKDIAKYFKNIDQLLAYCNVETLSNIDGVGTKSAEQIVNWINTNIDLILNLKQIGFNLSIEESAEEILEPGSLELVGQKFVITGSFLTSSRRDELAELVINNGGQVQSSVNKLTSFVIAGENPGRNKIVKANSLDIPIISEQYFLGMI